MGLYILVVIGLFFQWRYEKVGTIFLMLFFSSFLNNQSFVCHFRCKLKIVESKEI